MRTSPAVVLAGTLIALLVAPAAASATRLSHDVNGDGLADVAAPGVVDGQNIGGATVVFGARDRSAPASLVAPGARGFRITSEDAQPPETAEVIGDVNGDGLADVLVQIDIGAFVVFGKPDTAPVALDDGKGGVNPAFKDGQLGVAAENAEYARGAGDVDGDGLADITYDDEDGRQLATVRFGSRTAPLRARMPIRSRGRVQKEGGLRPTILPAGDTNGDGRDDLALAVTDPNGRADGFDVEEMVFVIRGRRDHRRVMVSQGRRSSGARVRSRHHAAGFAVFHRRRDCFCETFKIAPVGDLNGDGRGELGIAWMDPGSSRHSRVDIVFGRHGSSPVTLPGPRGAVIARGSWVTPFAGGLGDLTGDGRADMLVAAEGSREGSLRLLGGKRAHGRVQARSLPIWIAATADPSIVEPAGDVDGDGHGDLLVAFTDDGTLYAIVYGAAPLAPLDLAHPGAAATILH
ncbi:MAG: hypothetical protein QOG15_2853 [Solirubrobacteraceae bacterium]|jgi:hypothetical protein|nr:hypothetical protein [Solirubrobacteraceae bacterium]